MIKTISGDSLENIQAYTEYLKLPTVRKHYLTDAKEAAVENISYEEYLLRLLQRESDTRLEHAKEKRIRQANFPQKSILRI